MIQTRRIDNRAYDAIKGVLIFLVILDHNEILRAPRGVQDLFLPITFHVAGFLLLPFLGTPHRLSARFLSDRAARYLVPFMMTTIGYALVYHLLLPSGETFMESANNVALALFFGNAFNLKVATGFVFLWFLPTLFTLVITYAILQLAPRPFAACVLTLACFVHLTLGVAPVWVRQWTPGDLHLALFILPLGLLMRQLHLRLQPLNYPHRLGFAALAVLLAAWAIEYGHESEVASAKLPSILEPGHLLAIDASIIACMIMLLSFASLLARIPLLLLLGRYSLIVYLVHPLIYYPVLTLLDLMHPAAHLDTFPGFSLYVAATLGSVIFTTAVSVIVAIGLERHRPLASFLMPRTWHDWLPVSLLR